LAISIPLEMKHLNIEARSFMQECNHSLIQRAMTFLMHWTFKTGYHEIAARKFLATGAPFPQCTSMKRFHAPGSVEGWILVEADRADACYEHAAEWAECLNWEVTPVLTDEEAGPLMAKAYS
jgi:hypothetical protein|tara:strand:+ start:457 stop:822 length:366 start_codon:yes stop_codon:yes gene_type:complete